LSGSFGGTGAETPLPGITSSRISAWKADRLAATCPQTKKGYSAAAINRPLAALRHLVQLSHEEWEVLPTVPRIRLEKEPEGRIRRLEPGQEQRLLEASRASRTEHLAAVVTLALESELRKGELLGLTWDRVDMSRGVLRLELTKSGKRREVPMRQAVYDVLTGLPGPREGRVWPSGNVRTAFENAVEVARLDDFHFHDCRPSLRVVVRDAGWEPAGLEGGPRTRGLEDDPPLCPPGAGPSARGDGQDRGAAASGGGRLSNHARNHT